MSAGRISDFHKPVRERERAYVDSYDVRHGGEGGETRADLSSEVGATNLVRLIPGG